VRPLLFPTTRLIWTLPLVLNLDFLLNQRLVKKAATAELLTAVKELAFSQVKRKATWTGLQKGPFLRPWLTSCCSPLVFVLVVGVGDAPERYDCLQMNSRVFVVCPFCCWDCWWASDPIQRECFSGIPRNRYWP
jgi:hypothetical protein